MITESLNRVGTVLTDHDFVLSA